MSLKNIKFKPFRICLILFLFLVSLGFNIYILVSNGPVSSRTLAAAAKVNGLRFTFSERKLMKEDVKENLNAYNELRKHTIDNGISPVMKFDPVVPGVEIPKGKSRMVISRQPKLKRPDNLEDLAFYPVTQLAQLIRSRQITSVELTRMYLDRLKKYGPKLECVITLTEELAMKQARRADREISEGYYRGPLHGIPWGAKDLLATKGIKTTWGAMPYKDQIFDEDATVVKKLEEAGAVLVAKLTMGALAWGDVWFGGKTRNPWDVEQGSSGSSAGSASAVAAGLVGFAIGTETWGSIVSPSTRCGVIGLRPTFGMVSRWGAMALSWSMDKIGPICRGVEDCALVFDVIRGSDGKDLSVIDAPFRWDSAIDVKDIRIGFLQSLFEEEYSGRETDMNTLETLRSLGAELIPIALPDLPVASLSFILNTEAAAAFDDLTRNGRDDLLVRQSRDAWPNAFRQARLIPAVEYIQANRMRHLLMQAMADTLRNINVYVAPSFQGDNLLLTNLTGHPAVVLPNGFNETGHPLSITFVGNLFQEGKVLAVAKAYQDATDFHLKHTDLEK